MNLTQSISEGCHKSGCEYMKLNWSRKYLASFFVTGVIMEQRQNMKYSPFAMWKHSILIVLEDSLSCLCHFQHMYAQTVNPLHTNPASVINVNKYVVWYISYLWQQHDMENSSWILLELVSNNVSHIMTHFLDTLRQISIPKYKLFSWMIALIYL
jgi:hypothetical protein